MSKRDEFDDPEGFLGRLITVKSGGGPSMFENKSLILSIIVFVVVVALSGVIWASYPSRDPLVGDGAVPVIRADAEPYKHLPDDRGGMAIPHRDSTVFAAMRGDGTGPKVENLLDTEVDEKPVDRTQLFAGLKTNLATPGVMNDGPENMLGQKAVTTAPAHEKNQKPVDVARMGDYTQDRPLTEAERRAQAAERNKDMLVQPAAPLPAANGTGSKQPEQVAAPDDEPADMNKTSASTSPKNKKGVEVKSDKAAKPVDDKPVAGQPARDIAGESVAVKIGIGASYVQVASVPSETLVKSEFKTVSSKLPMVSGMPYRVQKADVKGKGVFHRIQVGPMSVDDATKLCAAIKTKKPGGCLVVK